MRHGAPLALASFRNPPKVPLPERRPVHAVLAILLFAMVMGASCGGAGTVADGDRNRVEAAAIRYVIAYYWANECVGPLDIEVMAAREEEESQQLVQLDEEVLERIRTLYPRVQNYSKKTAEETNAGSFHEIGPPWGGSAELLVVVGSVKRIDAASYDVQCRWHCGRRCGGVLRLTVKGIGDRRTVTNAELKAVS